MGLAILPFPPTANNLFINRGKGRVKSPRYRHWQTIAGKALMACRVPKVAGRYVMTLTAERPDRRGRDIANLEKSVSDLLVMHGVVEDDKLAQKLVLQWSELPPSKDAVVYVEIAPYAPA